LYKVASQVYVGVLSQPQLYQEGNHRTGSLIASGILLQNGCPPFVLTQRDAVSYFNPSSEIKFSDKRTIRGKLRLPKYRREFREFLQQKRKPGLCALVAVIRTTTRVLGRLHYAIPVPRSS
jgi:hypothetical protein